MNLTFSKLIVGFEAWLKSALPTLAEMYYTESGPPGCLDADGQPTVYESFEDFAVDVFACQMGMDTAEA